MCDDVDENRPRLGLAVQSSRRSRRVNYGIEEVQWQVHNERQEGLRVSQLQMRKRCVSADGKRILLVDCSRREIEIDSSRMIMAGTTTNDLHRHENPSWLIMFAAVVCQLVYKLAGFGCKAFLGCLYKLAKLSASLLVTMLCELIVYIYHCLRFMFIFIMQEICEHTFNLFCLIAYCFIKMIAFTFKMLLTSYSGLILLILFAIFILVFVIHYHGLVLPCNYQEILTPFHHLWS